MSNFINIDKKIRKIQRDNNIKKTLKNNSKNTTNDDENLLINKVKQLDLENSLTNINNKTLFTDNSSIPNYNNNTNIARESDISNINSLSYNSNSAFIDSNLFKTYFSYSNIGKLNKLIDENNRLSILKDIKNNINNEEDNNYTKYKNSNKKVKINSIPCSKISSKSRTNPKTYSKIKGILKQKSSYTKNKINNNFNSTVKINNNSSIEKITTDKIKYRIKTPYKSQQSLNINN